MRRYTENSIKAYVLGRIALCFQDKEKISVKGK